jgi:hypothetical protein
MIMSVALDKIAVREDSKININTMLRYCQRRWPLKALWELYVRTAAAINNCVFCVYVSGVILRLNRECNLNQQ